MVKNTLILVLFYMFLLVPLISAEVFTADEDMNIIYAVRTNDAVTSTALCNITIKDPDKNILVNFEQMVYSSTSQTYSYTLPGTNTSELGEYCYDITCVDGVLNNTESFCDTVNPIGKEYSTAESITYIFVLIVMMGIFGLLVYWANALPWRNERNQFDEIIRVNWKKHLKIACIGLAYVLLVWIVFLSWNLSFGYLQMRGLGLFFMYLFSLLVGLALPVFVSIVIFSLIAFLNDKKISKYIERGIPIR